MIKKFFYGCYKCMQSIVMFLPFYCLRYLWLKIFCKKYGKNGYISRNIDVRSPWRCCIGNNVVINKHCVIDGRGGVLIGDNVDIAQDVHIWTAEHDVKSTGHIFISKPVTISDNVWIASRVTILPGIVIGEGAVIGSGSVVTKDVVPYTVVAGNPAKKIGERNNDLSYTLQYKSFFE